MGFRSFLNEDVKLAKELNARLIGTFSWWKVYAAKTVVVNSQILKQIFGDAAYRLSTIGFTKQGGVAIIANLSKEKNRITGGGLGGYASTSGHAMVIDINNINADVIVHEAAHMMWKNLPRANKQYFTRWYRQNIGVKIKDQPEDTLRWQELTKNLDQKKVSNEIHGRIKGYTYEMIHDSYKVFGRDIQSYINLLNSQTGDEYFHFTSIVPTKTTKAILKQDMEFKNYNGYPRMVKAGATVYVERLNNNKYVLNWYDGNLRYEADIYTVNNKISDFVSGVDNNIEKDAIKLKNSKIFRFLADPTKKDEIGMWFWKAAEGFGKYLPLFAGESGNYNVKEIFRVSHPLDFYNTWAALVRLRFKDKNITIQDVLDAIIAVFTKKLKSFKDMIKSPIGKVPSIHVPSLDIPQAKLHRDMIHKAGLAPNAYGASNTDELWATAIEYGSKNIRNISPKLKQAIINTMTGNITA